jgi:exodeoxyribonuclease III
MKIATWNVNSLRARHERLVEWLVVCLQETKMADDAVDLNAYADLGYDMIHHGDGRWNGVALLSRVGIEEPLVGFGVLGEEHGGRIIGARCGDFQVFSVYVPNGRSLDDPHYAIKLTWMATLRAHLEAVAQSDDKVIVAGDFNVTPADEDVWDPTQFVGMTHVSQPERDALAALCAYPLVDLAAEVGGAARAFTWWDYRNLDFPKGRGMRIDLILATPAARAQVIDVTVDRAMRKGVKPSDHAPVVATFSG